MRADRNPLSAAELGAWPAGILSRCPGPRIPGTGLPPGPNPWGVLSLSTHVLPSNHGRVGFLPPPLPYSFRSGSRVLEAQKLVGVNINPSGPCVLESNVEDRHAARHQLPFNEVGANPGKEEPERAWAGPRRRPVWWGLAWAGRNGSLAGLGPNAGC